MRRRTRAIPRPPRAIGTRRLLRSGAVVLAAVLALGACGAASSPGNSGEGSTPTHSIPPARPSVEERAANVGVQLFQWSWSAIAAECTTTLGPAGYAWVLTSPPQEHILGDEWWTHYQPVSYQLESRLGTRQEFAAMVQTCADAGVAVIADAVINHMSGQNDPGIGWAGSEYEHYRYPGIYEPEDFHQCGTADHDIQTYSDAHQVQFCELVNLADLATEAPAVRAKIVAYLEDLLSLGVAGFRIDAAKHMPADDVEAIVAQLPEDTVIYQEVIRGAGEPIQPEDYLAAGDVFEFSWGREIQPIVGRSSIRMFYKLGETSIFAPSDQALTFVENHDTERNDEALTYRDGTEYYLATVLTLAHDYGTPVVYSGFAFSDRDDGAATGADGAVLPAACDLPSEDIAELLTHDWADGSWVCQHAWPTTVAMVQWANVAGSAPIANAWDDRDALAFSRGDRAFVAVNRGDETLSATWQTGLAEGQYRDVLGGGAVVTVAADGTLTADLAPGTALAIHIGARATQ